MSKKTDAKRARLAVRAVLITGIHKNVDAEDLINSFVTSHDLKKPQFVLSLPDDDRGQPRHAVLLQHKEGRDKLLSGNIFKYNGKRYNLFVHACTEEDIPEDWLKWLGSLAKKSPASGASPVSSTSGNTDQPRPPSRQNTESLQSTSSSHSSKQTSVSTASGLQKRQQGHCDGDSEDQDDDHRPEDRGSESNVAQSNEQSKTSAQSSFVPSSSSSKDKKEDDPKVIEVRGFSSDTTSDALKFYFENTRRSGGGKVEKFELNKKKTMALVYFEDYNDAKRVLKQESHVLNKTKVQVTTHVEEVEEEPQAAAATETSDEEEEEFCTIEVRGCSKGTSDDTIVFYFENKRRGGGEKVTVFERKNEVIYITFETADEAQRVLQKKHAIEGKNLQVTFHIPKPCYKNRLLVTDLDSTTNKEDLKNFMEAKSHCNVSSIVYGEEPGIALVTFTRGSLPDLIKLKEECKKTSFHGNKLVVSTVPVTNSIMVQGLDSKTTKDTITLYFEGRRSGNVENVSVKNVLHSNRGSCIVQFENSEVVDAVVDHSDHNIDGHILAVSLDIEGLGTSRPKEDQTWYQQPESFTIESLNKHKSRFIKKTKEVDLKKELAECHADITWHTDDTAELKCTLTDKTPGAVKKARTWKEDSQNCLVSLMDAIKVEELTPLSQIWQDVKSQLQEVTTPGVRMLTNDAVPNIVIVGDPAHVPTLAKVVNTIIKDVEEEFNRRKEEVTEKITSLKPMQIRLLSELGLHTQMIKSHKDMTVTVDLKQNEIVFKGQIKEVQSCKIQVFEAVNSFVAKEEHNFSDARLALLRQKEVKDIIEKKIKDKKLKAVWEVQSGYLFVLSTSDKDASSVVGIIGGVVVEHKENLELESVSLLTTDRWSRLVGDIKSANKNLVNIIPNPGNNSVTIVVMDSIASNVITSIQKFCSENAVYTAVIHISKPVHKFIIMHREAEIRKTGDKILKENGRIDYMNGKPKITVHGCKTVLDKGIQELTSILKKVQNKKESLKKPAGIGRYIRSEKIRSAIADTEKNEQCVIELEYTESENFWVEGGATRRGAIGRPRTARPKSAAAGTNYYARCIIDDVGRQIDVVMGDMTTMKVDAIVNAANNRLDHVGGLAWVIAKAGGPAIQKESDDYIKKHKEVVTGDAVPTGPGKLPCKMVVHAVGPVWSGGTKGEERDLKKAVMVSMECADRKGFTSIVIPALSSGIFGYPIDRATKHIVEAIKTYYILESPNSSLTHVYLMDVNPKCIKLFVSALQDVYSDQTVTVTQNRPATASGPRPSQRPQSGVSSPAAARTSSPESITISIVKGEIAKQKADVIVNSTGSDLDLAKGIVSKSVLDLGGQSLQTELNKKYSKGIQPGEIAISDGGTLKCRKVYHTCLPSWSDESCADLLMGVVHTCLDKASSAGCRSIAFPALGTGKLGYPRDIAAQTMFAAVKDFERQNKSIEEVFFVVYHGDRAAIKAFEREQSDASGSLEEEEDMFSAQSPGAEDSFKIELVKGELNSQKADVIVNSAASDLDLNKGAVAKSLLKTGGDTLQKELKSSHPKGIKHGDIAVSSGGKLQCKKVYHICLPDWSGQSGQKILRDIVHNCLQKASDAGFKSIAFPALGTGNLGYPKGLVASTMYTTMAHFQQRNKSLKEVKIVIYHKDTPVIQAFEENRRQRASGALPDPCFTVDNDDDIYDDDEEIYEEYDGLGVGRLRFEVKQGDITQERVDCIVNSSNRDLDLTNGGVSQAISKACGQDMTQQCSNKVSEMKKKGVVSTTAKGLHCKYVIHVAGSHFGNNWTAVIIACLEEAEKLGDVTSLAFPVLGTGAGLSNPKAMAAIMVQAVNQFEPKAVNVKELKVVVFQEAMLEPFTTQFKDSVGNLNTGMPSKGAIAQTSVDLYFFSDNTKQIKKGLATLETKCTKEIVSRDFKDPVIKQLTSVQIQGLKNNHDVEIVVDKVKGKAEIIGLAADVGFALATMTSYLRTIEKAAGTDFDPPKTWKKMPDKVNFDIHDLATTDKEYVDVSKEFMSSIESTTAKVINIKRIQNRPLYQQYTAKRKQLLNENPKGTQNERSLWHGTSTDTIDSINQNGYNRSYCGKNATAHGQGVYFAVKSSYSACDTYSRPDPQGHKYMYLAKVLTGIHATGAYDLKTPPPKPNGKGPTDLCDSVSDDVKNPNMFVVFNDTQAYPEYLLTFSR